MKIRLLSSVFIICASICFLFSCESKDEGKVYYEQQLTKLDGISSYKYVIILPGLGCQGCISGVEEYIKNNIERNDIFFILTAIESLKMLQNKIGVDLRNRDNVLIDLDNEFLLTSNKSIYPIVLRLEGSHIKALDYISPETDKTLVDKVTWDD
ncbi:hypothetical protein [Belliella pelovolcani]|uniref:Uncharacterized protein n=1 Tax=Belliella pelovolcani TaxID=529505 RepID=A0A1N7JIB9_9BACT|nr:hypothetical protein [Belliella pelovolcani]SIS48996.1 hypothetical protein SAMN05421761_10124 [Belliella pelovolcani]